MERNQGPAAAASHSMAAAESTNDLVESGLLAKYAICVVRENLTAEDFDDLPEQDIIETLQAVGVDNEDHARLIAINVAASSTRAMSDGAAALEAAQSAAAGKVYLYPWEDAPQR